jgi:ribosomal protein L11 methyltransferase
MAAAAALPGARVVAGDIDAVAVEVTRANLAANRLAAQVTAVEAAGFDHPGIAAAAPFDLVFANILKGPLIELAPAVAAHLAPGGRAILSGLLADQAEAVLAAYAAAGLASESRSRIGDWVTLVVGTPGLR